MKKTICITLEEGRIKDIDRIRGMIPRSTFIDKFLEKHLNFQTAKEFLNSCGEDAHEFHKLLEK